MIIDHHAGRPTRHLMLRPAILLLAVLLLAAGGFAGGLYYKPPGDPDLMPQYLQLQRENAKLQTELASREASIAIKNAQIDQYEKDGKAMQAKIKAQGDRLDTFDSIVEAMKLDGIHLVHSQALWPNAQTLSYHFIVVKGGNYPRSVAGYFKCYVTDPASGKYIALPWHNGQEKLPYQVVNDTFVDGHMDWKQAWKPASLLLVRYDPADREKGRYTIAVQGAN
jgi:uncharacterized protein YxeA